MNAIERLRMRCALRWLVVIAVLQLASLPAFAGTIIGVGQTPPPPMGPFIGDDDNEDMIMVGSLTNPIPITPDPSSTVPWMKQFVINRDGQGWSSSGPNSMVTVMEVFAFTPTTLPIIDWHEDIDPTVGDGGMFKWAGGTITTPEGTFPGLTGTDGKSIWFDFPPVPPGAPIKVTKQLMWIGPPSVVTPGPNGTNNYIIKVNERPSIPEPCSGTLLGIATAGLLGRRLRRR